MHIGKLAREENWNFGRATLLRNFQTVVIIGGGKSLNGEEKSEIVQQLKQAILYKADICRHETWSRTTTRVTDDPLKKVVKKDQDKIKALSRLEVSRVTLQLRKTPTISSNFILKNAGKSTRCWVLRRLANHVKLEIRPPLKENYKETRWHRRKNI